MSATMPDGFPLDESSEEVATALFVVTGLVGDSTRIVEPEHPTWRRVAYAQRQQDAWRMEAHAAFWTALLPELPRAGRPRRIDLLSRAAAALHAHGLDDAAIADVLGVARNTVRLASKHSRPSLEHGQTLLQEARRGDQGDALMRLSGSRWFAEEALPRVFVSADAANASGGHFNHHVASGWVPGGVEYATAAENELRRRWRAG